MIITIDNRTHIADAPAHLQAAIQAQLTFTNPKWLDNNRMGRWQGNTPREIRCYEDGDAGALIIPRGFTGQLLHICREAGKVPVIIDETRQLDPVEFNFTGQLRPFQEPAVDDILSRRHTTLSAATGAGKTIMSLAIIAQRRQPALVVVHTKELLNQWVDRAVTFLGIPAKEIGIIGGGKKRIGDKLNIALVQSLYKVADEIAPYIGHLVVDECHRAPSRKFTEAVTAFDCKYLLGLSATPYRRDRLSQLIFFYLGNVHHQVDKAELIAGGHILKAKVINRETSFRAHSDPSAEYSAMLKELTADRERNAQITADVASQMGQGVALVLSDRKSHCHDLQEMLKAIHGINAEVLTGDTPTKQREALVEKINAGDVPVLIATGQLIGEGFDCRHLSNLFLATPIKFSGRLLQYTGRILRPGPGKATPRVYDYIDVNVGPLVAAAKARQRVYRQAA